MKNLKNFRFNLAKVKLNNIEFISLIIILFLIGFKPQVLVNLSNTFIGKLILLILIILSAMYSKFIGLLVTLLTISILESKYNEGLENMDTSDDTTDDTTHDTTDDTVKEPSNDKSKFEKEMFLKKHCKNINGKKELVDLSGKRIELKNINKIYKNINFKNELCNPCESTCDFSLTYANEKLSIDEKLKSKDSNK